MDFSSLLNLLLLIFGFGFVIFWHELGHFLAAKWAGVKVEQFAVGFGHALLCFRKGLGVTIGTSAGRVERVLEAERRRLEEARQATGSSDQISYRTKGESDVEILGRLGVSETEYRLNWIPLGGYVKMLGQDDMNANASSPDPRAYNNKPIGKRMVIVSAGVIMNIILAAILFWVLFLHGFRAPAPVVGYAQAGSPAQRAGLESGDRILRYNGDVMHDFTKIRLATALAHPSEPSTIVVRKPDGHEATLRIIPLPEASEGGFLQIGVGPAPLLEAPDKLKNLPPAALTSATARLLNPGERIVAVNGKPLPDQDSAPDAALKQFDTAIQLSGGDPIQLTVRALDGGATREVAFRPEFEAPFGNQPLNFLGMRPRVTVGYLQENSAAREKLMPGDVVVRIAADNGSRDAIDNPTLTDFLKTVESASDTGVPVSVEVERSGKRLSFPGIPLNVKIESLSKRDRLGLGIGLDQETYSTVVSSVIPDSAAAKAGMKSGMRVTAVNGIPVGTWIQVKGAAQGADPTAPVRVSVSSAAGEEDFTLRPTAEEVERLKHLRLTHGLLLKERTWVRQTSNPLTALAWGAGETRDLIVQFYITLKRMIVQQSISVSQMSGPLGILHSGTVIASRGTDWLIWYLAVISANLAVVNFLPIPIVDGGLFLFLIIEKLRGRPVSPKVMTVTQLVGLALIVSLFLFVTYNDFLRLM